MAEQDLGISWMYQYQELIACMKTWFFYYDTSLFELTWQAMYHKVLSYAGETTDLVDDLIDLEKLLDDDTFMHTAP